MSKGNDDPQQFVREARIPLTLGNDKAASLTSSVLPLGSMVQELIATVYDSYPFQSVAWANGCTFRKPQDLAGFKPLLAALLTKNGLTPC